MENKIIIANHKINIDAKDISTYLSELGKIDTKNVVICPTSIYIPYFLKKKFKVGIQNTFIHESGSYTGEVSPKQARSLGVSYTILGHSERRAMFAETDETVNLKVKAALAHDLKPIVCCGESLEERENGTTHQVLDVQIAKAFEEIAEESLNSIIVAYEPIWAIGTGKVASPEMADEACGYIRSLIEKLYSTKAAEEIRILYGGSVSTKSVNELMAQPNIDGGLVGGASLKADSFVELCQAAQK